MNKSSSNFPETHRVLAAEPGHLLEDALVDVAFLLEQVLQLAALLLQVLNFQFQAFRFAFVAVLLLPLVVLQYSVRKRGANVNPAPEGCVNTKNK